MERVSDIKLGERSKAILEIAIENYISYGAPVGSRTLSKNKKINLSAASIRNIMADLEDLGLLSQPHTSAGRVPTDLGYRCYIELIMKAEKLSPQEKKAIRDCITGYSGDLASVMGQTSKVLSQFSHNIGVALYPKISKCVFKHIKFVKLFYPKILVILVSRSGTVFNKVIEIEEELSQIELDNISSYIVDKFEGMSLFFIRQMLLQMMKEEKAAYDRMMRNVITVSSKSFSEMVESDFLFYDGASKILEFPEFSNLETMKTIFRTLEERERLIKILAECIEGEGVQIIIGSENSNEEFKDLSLVMASYNYKNSVLGSLGIIGPTRMSYAKAISLVDYVSYIVSRTISCAEL